MLGAQAVVLVEERRSRLGEFHVYHVTAAGIRYTQATSAAAAPPESSSPPAAAFGPRFPAAPPPPDPEDHAQVQFLMRLGWDFGTTKLVEVRYVDGSTSSLGVNDGLRLDVGVAVPDVASGRFETQLTVGLRYNQISGSNGNIEYTTWPIEALQCLNLGRWRLGAGAALYLAPKLSGSGVGAPATATFDTTMGPIAELGYRTRHLPLRGDADLLVSMALRYGWTRLSAGGASVDGSTIGFNFGFAF